MNDFFPYFQRNFSGIYIYNIFLRMRSLLRKFLESLLSLQSNYPQFNIEILYNKTFKYFLSIPKNILSFEKDFFPYFERNFPGFLLHSAENKFILWFRSTKIYNENFKYFLANPTKFLSFKKTNLFSSWETFPNFYFTVQNIYNLMILYVAMEI